MLNIRAFKEAAPSFAVYPILCSQTTHYNSGIFIKLATTFVRRLLPKYLTEGFEFEAGCEYGRLDEIFTLPDPQTANQRMLDRLMESLERRYAQEAAFKLD